MVGNPTPFLIDSSHNESGSFDKDYLLKENEEIFSNLTMVDTSATSSTIHTGNLNAFAIMYYMWNITNIFHPIFRMSYVHD